MVHFTSGDSGGFAFAEVELAVVLVPDGDGGGGILSVDTVGDEEVGLNPVAGLDFVAEEMAGEAVGLFSFEDFCI